MIQEHLILSLADLISLFLSKSDSSESDTAFLRNLFLLLIPTTDFTIASASEKEI